MKNDLLNYMSKRLLETSTIRGIILTVGAFFGYQLTDTQTETFIFLILGIIGIASSFLPDDLSDIFHKLIKEKKDELGTRSDE